MVRHFLKDDDLTPKEQAEVIRRAIELKKNPYSAKPFAGPKTVALIFDKTSTRTRVSFAVGVADLGGSPLIIDSQTSQMGGKESIADTARVLGRQVAQIVWRTYAHSGLEEMAEHAGVPVINSLSDDYHPCQILADLLTILAISLVTSKGAHGVPGSAIVVLAATLQAIPAIPAIGLVLVLSVDWFIGIARALGNLIGKLRSAD